MSDKVVIKEISKRGVATLTLNRERANNTLDEALIRALTEHFYKLKEDKDVRALTLTARGKNFCAGADLDWLKQARDTSFEDNLKYAEALKDMMQAFASLPQPTLVLAHGAVYGAGIGLVACADVAVASDTTSFCFSEVKLGLTPAVIAPYIVQAMGARATRRYFLTGERFGAAEAQRLGLIHEVASPAEVEAIAEHLIRALLDGGPEAQKAAKMLVHEVEDKKLDQKLMANLTRKTAESQVSDEAQEGIQAFIEKRLPTWKED